MAGALESLVGEMTVAELAKKSGRSVEDLVGWAMGSAKAARGRPAAAATSSGRGGARGGSKRVDTRTAAGREAYEKAVLESVRASKGPIAAQEIRAKLGGTPQQARAALNRLIEEGQINYQGRARATRYTAA